MIDYSSLAYFLFSMLCLILSYFFKLKSDKTGIKSYVVKINDIRKGKKYLKFLLEQLSKAINEKENFADTNLKDILPDYDRNNTKIPFFTIFYATQSNTAKKFADKIADDAKILNLNCQAKNISEISLEDFNRNLFMVFMVSTYGEGGPSDDCIEFNKLLEKKSRGKSNFFEEFTNQNLHFSIFGLGSSKYEHFNEMAKKFDFIFSKNGIKRIYDVGLGDDAKNINEDFQNWRKNFWSKSQQFFSENSDKITQLIKQMKLSDLYEGSKEETVISLDNHKKEEEEYKFKLSDYDFSIKRFLQSEECLIEDISELRKENINGSTLKITYSLDNTSLKYQVGDNIGVFPTNNDLSVKSLVSRLNYDENATVNVKKLKSERKKKLAILNGYTIKELLTNFVDLSCHVNKELLEKLLKYCFDEDQYEAIQLILKRENKLKEFLNKNYNIKDFLTVYDSVNIPFIEFYNLMPKITPRFYTVASSPNYKVNKLEIIISLVEWKGGNNQTRYGITSNYYKNIFDSFKLNSSEKKFKTRLIVRESTFKLPQNSETHLVMICTGTGIAPFISFFQEFDFRATATQSICNESTLIFGSKNRKFDFIFENELSEYRSKGVIKNLYTAFSRDQDKKMYVQHVLEEKKNELEHLILKESSLIYICGGVSMGAEVVNSLEKHFSRDFVKKMESENRLIKELWG